MPRGNFISLFVGFLLFSDSEQFFLTSSELKLGISANISFKLNELCHNKKGKSLITLWKRSNRSNFTFMSLRLNFTIPLFQVSGLKILNSHEEM